MIFFGGYRNKILTYQSQIYTRPSKPSKSKQFGICSFISEFESEGTKNCIFDNNQSLTNPFILELMSKGTKNFIFKIH